jgi:hypothetical protein
VSATLPVASVLRPEKSWRLTFTKTTTYNLWV